MARNHNEFSKCPLMKREIQYGECYEVQEIRNGEMSMSLAVEQFSIQEANTLCEQCRWYVIC